MTIIWCIPKIQQTLGMVELVCSTNILSQLRSEMICPSMKSIVIELNFGRKSFSLQCYIEVQPLLSSKYFFQTLQIYIPKSKTKIHARPFLLVILTTQLRREGKLKIFKFTKPFSTDS